MEKRHISLRKQVLPVLVTLLLVCTVILCFSVVIQVLTTGYASFFGNSLFRVVTGSMEPELPTGSLILSREIDIEELDVGDVICFRSLSPSPSMQGRIITHRIVTKSIGEDGEVILLTKGDANPSIDGYPVMAENLIGIVVWNSGDVSILSDLVAFFSSQIGFMTCIALPVLIIAGSILRNSVGSIRNDIKKSMESLLEMEKSRSAPKTMPHPTAAKPSDGDEAILKPAIPVDHQLIPPGISPEEYAEMQERIRAELIEEIKQEMSARIRAELLEELRQENDREKTKEQ